MQTNLTNNPLLRRVQRHANMATLFRQVDGAVAPRPLPAPTNAPAQPPAAVEFVPTAVPTPQPSAPTPKPITPAAPAAAADPNPDDERDWSRLQTIFRKHQQRIAAEEGGSAEPDTPPQPTPQQTETAVQRTPDPAPKPAPPAPVQPDSAAPPVARHPHPGGEGGATAVGGDLKVQGGLAVSGPMTVGGSARVSGPTAVSGGLSSGAEVRTGPATITGSVTAGTELKQAGGTQISGSTTSGTSTTIAGATTIGQSVTAGTDVKTAGGTIVSGSVMAGSEVKNAGPTAVGGSVTAGTDVTVIGGVSVAQGVTAGSKATFLGGAQITGDAQTGSNLTVIGPATIGGSAVTSGNLTVTGSATIGGSAVVGGGVKAGGNIIVAGELQPPIAPASGAAAGGGAGAAPVQQKRADDAPPAPAAPADSPQPAPLESAWPGVVRRASQPKAVPSPTIQRAPAAAPPQMVVTGGADSAVAPAIQQKLAAVQPGQPTDSAVELVLPRRPRPNQPGKMKMDRLQIEEPPIANRQSPIPENHSPDEIATDIGPLPADLWQLVGRTPPQTQANPVVQRQVAADGEMATAVSPTPTPPPAVQRAVQVDEVETTVAERDTPADDETAVTAGDDIDIDELAQKVFQDLRRRLSAEWERARGRFNQ